MVLKRFRSLQNYSGRTVAHLAVCDVTVFNIDNGPFQIFCSEIVNENFTVRAELFCEASGDLDQQFQRIFPLDIPSLSVPISCPCPFWNVEDRRVCLRHFQTGKRGFSGSF